MDKKEFKKELENLDHTRIKITGGGEVILVDTGAILDPEQLSMIQAKHSRSAAGFDGHIEDFLESGSDTFMSTYYVKYGHKSIGDCGNVTLFIEGVSMLAAKAIQDWPLYNGQEASTRYIDFQEQPFVNPTGTRDGKNLLEACRSFYSDSLELVKAHLRTQLTYEIYEKNMNEKNPNDVESKKPTEEKYEKAINARAFDILRGFLPAGATTNLAWTTNLRQAADKLMLLRHHPLEEVRNIATALEEALKKGLPNSFNQKRYPKTEAYNQEMMSKHYYYHEPTCSDFEFVSSSIDVNLLDFEILSSRPRMTELPKWLAEAGEIKFKFRLDFGSWRDIQRQRSIVQRMPLLTTEIGFETWYLEQLPEKVLDKARNFLQGQQALLSKMDCSREELQYYIPMGYQVSNSITGSLPAMVYVTELRATSAVHPTLAKKAVMIGEKLLELYSPYGLVLHFDKQPHIFDGVRGDHDIVTKE